MSLRCTVSTGLCMGYIIVIVPEYTIHHTPHTIDHIPYTIHHKPYTIHNTQPYHTLLETAEGAKHHARSNP
ncbi:hypothetical protein EON63_22635 [archaeon]|nr:MAG: hypothetical protein EON63_22635 [archaeon]